MKTFIDNYAQAKQVERDSLIHPTIKNELEAFWEEIESRYMVKFK